jgi:hypothetical protein
MPISPWSRGLIEPVEIDERLAESIDRLSALAELGVSELTRAEVLRTLGMITKTLDDHGLR